MAHTRGTLDLSCWYLRAQHLPGAVVRSVLLLLLLVQRCQRAPAGRATPLCLGFSPVWTPKPPPWSCGASGSAGCPWVWCWGRRCSQPPLPIHARAEDECGCASSLPHCPSPVTPLPNGCGQGLRVTPLMFQSSGELCQSPKLEGTPQSMQLPKQ